MSVVTEQVQQVLDAFPIVNVNVWISVTAFLHYIVQQEEDRARMIGMCSVQMCRIIC